jgi:hypothetical protein
MSRLLLEHRSVLMSPGGDNVIEELKAIYQRFPNDDLADLLDSFIREGY